MAGDSQSTVKSMNHLSANIDIMNFDGTNNFVMWRCEVMDTLTLSNFEDTLRLEEKPEETYEKDLDKKNRTTCGIIRLCLAQDIKYHVMTETFARKI